MARDGAWRVVLALAAIAPAAFPAVARGAADGDLLKNGGFAVEAGGLPAGSNFVDHGGLLTEVCLLGNVAVRLQKKLTWDGAKLRFTDDDSANGLLMRPYRDGWTL